MPALTANSVTLDEILDVRAGPLSEEELWALLSQSSVALQDVFIKGKLSSLEEKAIQIPIESTFVNNVTAFPKV